MMSSRWKPLAIAAALGILTVAILSAVAHAQGTVSGRVTAQGTGQPLAEARILVIGSTLSANTSDDGRFTIRNVPVGTAQLQVLRVGYSSQKKTVTVAAAGTTTADFELGVAVAQLEEVVTTATGQQRKVELGNAISTLGDVGKRLCTDKVGCTRNRQAAQKSDNLLNDLRTNDV